MEVIKITAEQERILLQWECRRCDHSNDKELNICGNCGCHKN